MSDSTHEIALAFFVLLLLPVPALCQDTPMFRASLEHTGVYSAAAVPMFTGVKWKFQTNGRVISSPAVEDGLVYVGSMDKNLYAVDQQTGALKWKFAAEGPVGSSPALAGGIVYFASDDGKFYAPRGDRPVEMET
jgi:eukaryotic-like serine/threonine-protein kinase